MWSPSGGRREPVLSEAVFEFKKEKKVSSENMARFIAFISHEYENQWLIFLSDGDVIINENLRNALDILEKKKGVTIVSIVKAPNKSGIMFR